MELLLFLVPSFIHGWLMGNFSFTETEEEMATKPIMQGVDLYNAGKIAEAFRFFEDQSGQKLKIPYLHLYLGKCHYHFENYEAAVGAFEQCIRLDSTIREGYYYKAKCFYNLQEWQKACFELKKASRLHLDRNPELLRLLAEVDYRLGNFENARKNLRIAFDLDGLNNQINH